MQIKNVNESEYLLLRNRAKFERKSWYYAHLLNKDIYTKETRIFGLESFFLEAFKNIRKKFILENNLMRKKRFITTLIIQIISIVSTSLIVFLVFYDASIGAILIGSLMTLVSSITNIKNNFGTLLNGIYKMHEDSLFCQDIIDMLDYKKEDKQKLSSLKILDSEIECIHFKNVSFKYPSKNKYAIEKINIKFEYPQKYVIVGQNGSGKTTLLKLLSGFYKNYEGEILVNGHELRGIDLVDYRKKITAVFQDFADYQFKVKDIISLSSIENKDNQKKIMSAAIKSDANGFVQDLRLKYNQQIGTWFEGGTQISGGQWQKLSVARAYFRENASLVLFDEPSSALDPISESKLYKTFNNFTTNKISIFITHRLNNFAINGQIIVMEKGKIVESGDSTELLKDEKSLYFRMVNVKNELK